MYELFILILHRAWKYRRNAFIAVGGLAVLFIVLMIGLNSVAGAPTWLVKSVTIAANTMVAVVLLAMVYYVVRFVVLWLIWVLRELRILPEKRKEKMKGFPTLGQF
jgi:hypothetical protein